MIGDIKSFGSHRSLLGLELKLSNTLRLLTENLWPLKISLDGQRLYVGSKTTEEPGGIFRHQTGY